MAKVFKLAFVLIAGCATMNDVIRERQQGGGTSRVYSMPADAAWSLAIATLRDAGADAIEEHRQEGYMLTSMGVTAFTWGTMIGVWVQPQSPWLTMVTVVTKRKAQTTIATGLTEGGFQERFGQIATSWHAAYRPQYPAQAPYAAPGSYPPPPGWAVSARDTAVATTLDRGAQS